MIYVACKKRTIARASSLGRVTTALWFSGLEEVGSLAGARTRESLCLISRWRHWTSFGPAAPSSTRARLPPPLPPFSLAVSVPRLPLVPVRRYCCSSSPCSHHRRQVANVPRNTSRVMRHKGWAAGRENRQSTERTKHMVPPGLSSVGRFGSILCPSSVVPHADFRLSQRDLTLSSPALAAAAAAAAGVARC